MPRSMARPALLFTILALASISSNASAQAPPVTGVYTQFRLANSMSDGTPSPGEARVGGTWSTTAPLVSPGSITISNPYGMTSSSQFTATADHGDLRFAGSGSGNSVSGIGCFLWADDFIGAAPQAAYRYRVHVTSTTLPGGSPVSVQLALDLTGSAEVNDPFPTRTFSASAAAVTVGGPDLRALSLGGSTGSTTGTFATVVGDSFDVHGELDVTLQANGLLYGTPGLYSTIACDLRAVSSVTSLTPGVRLVTTTSTLDVPLAAPGARLALHGARPSPATAGHVRLGFALPSSAPATLEMFDISGRAMATAEVGGFGPGEHTFDIGRGERLGAGVYLVRLTQDRETRTARIVVIP